MVRESILAWRTRYKRYEPLIFFTAGFLFDVFTLRRIDDWLKLGFQILFLYLIGYFLILQHRAENPQWTPPRLLKKIWHYQIEIMHFMYGSLLSAYAIFYFKSASFTKSFIFLFLIVVLLILNELEAVRKQGLKLKMTLLSFCITSFFIYFFPVLIGSMSDAIFYSAVVLGALLIYGLILKFFQNDALETKKANIRGFAIPCLAVQAFIVISYVLKIIPPVPLSMTFGGIYHRVEKADGKFELYSLRPWYNFWSHGDSHFLARGQEPIYCFVRIFAPAKFSHTVFLRWQLYDERRKRYEDQDHIGLNVSGGREEGFRGFQFKNHYQTGSWRIVVETSDERPIGEISFKVENDPSAGDRVWMIEEG